MTIGETPINKEKTTIETLDLTKKDKVYEYTVTFTDRVTMGGAGVGESEEAFREELVKRFSGAKEFVIDEVKYIGTVSEIMANMKEEINDETGEEFTPAPKPLLN